MTETIEETTCGQLGDVRTGMASMGKGPYALPDGSVAQGMTGILAPDEHENVVIGMGSVVTVGGVRWEVVAVEKERGIPGSITLNKKVFSLGEG